MKGYYNPEAMAANIINWIKTEGYFDTKYYIRQSGGYAYIYQDEERTILLATVPSDKRLRSVRISISNKQGREMAWKVKWSPGGSAMLIERGIDFILNAWMIKFVPISLLTNLDIRDKMAVEGD